MLKNALFFGKSWKNRPVGLQRWGLSLQTPKLLLSINLSVTFEQLL